MDMTKNQQAFLKISEEIRRLQNSIQASDLLTQVINQQAYTKDRLRELKKGDVYVPEIQALMPMLHLAADSYDGVDKLRTKLKTRLAHLMDLSDAYLRGEDILLHKLAQD
jgi:hypothetical protein